MAAKKGIQDEDGLALRMMLETVTALRMFVNDELNELQFAISAVAENMLKPGKRSIVLLSSVCKTFYYVALPRSLGISFIYHLQRNGASFRSFTRPGVLACDEII